MTALVTRLSSAFSGDVSNLPKSIWDPGVNVTKRWVARDLTAVDGSVVPLWTDAKASGINLIGSGSGQPVVATEGGFRVIDFDGVDDKLIASAAIAATSMKTIVVIAKPRTADVAVNTAALFSAGGVSAFQNVASSTPQFSPNTVTLTSAAPLDKFHVYAATASGTSTAGLVSADGTSAAWTSGGTAWTTLNIANDGTTGFRKLRVVEVFTSDAVLNGTQLAALYTKAKAWYTTLAW